MHRRSRVAFLAVAASAAIIIPAMPAAADPRPLTSQLLGLAEPRPRANAAADDEVANIAHRGASAYAPENTVAALRLAKSQRADVFEVDVQQTRDHQLVLMHDSTLARTTNVEQVYPSRSPWRVSDFTLAEIRRLDAGSWFGADHRGERVPTLDQALRAMEGEGLGMLLEIKNPAQYPGIERRIARALMRTPSWLRPDASGRRLAVQSFDWNSVYRFHSALPHVPVGLIGTPNAGQLPRLALFADQVNPAYGNLSASYVRAVHAAGMDVYTWTVDDSGQMRRAIQSGVDGIVTNRPDVLHRVLRESDRRAAA